MVFSPGIIESLSSTELEAYLQNESRSQSEEDINKDIDFFLTKFKRILEIEDHSKRIESLLSLSRLELIHFHENLNQFINFHILNSSINFCSSICQTFS